MDGKITLEEALKNADAENNLRLRIELGQKGDKAAGGGGGKEDALGGLSLVEQEVEEDEEETIEGRAEYKLPDE